MYSIKAIATPLSHRRRDHFHNYNDLASAASSAAAQHILNDDPAEAIQRLSDATHYAQEAWRHAHTVATANRCAAAYDLALITYQDYLDTIDQPEVVTRIRENHDPLDARHQRISVILRHRDRTATWVNQVPQFDYRHLTLPQPLLPDYEPETHDATFVDDLAATCAQRGQLHGIMLDSPDMGAADRRELYYSLNRLLRYLEGADFDRFVRGIDPDIRVDLQNDLRRKRESAIA